MAKQAGDILNRVFKNPKGTGLGVGLLAAAGAAAYGAANSFYTGFSIL